MKPPGLIPARAGNTWVRRWVVSVCGAHPRSRGEHVSRILWTLRLKGSSPLARGTHLTGAGASSLTGLIPARAGNTKEMMNLSLPTGAHPRSRGEHSRTAFTPAFTTGSSPLARGTRSGMALRTLFLGLIPARAGNTSLVPRSFVLCWAHPRSRGEHRSQAAERAWELGSSPLARGTPAPVAATVAPPGLIPARAGNTERRPDALFVVGAHPRSRGEHSATVKVRYGVPGSSPLARGTRKHHLARLQSPGLIPARAGNTLSSTPKIIFQRAHPRSRGEH